MRSGSQIRQDQREEMADGIAPHRCRELAKSWRANTVYDTARWRFMNTGRK